jgi:hypothetical protein
VPSLSAGAAMRRCGRLPGPGRVPGQHLLTADDHSRPTYPPALAVIT